MMLKNFLDPRRSKRLISPWWLEFKLKKTAFAAEHMEKSHATYLVIGAATYDLSGKKKIKTTIFVSQNFAFHVPTSDY